MTGSSSRSRSFSSGSNHQLPKTSNVSRRQHLVVVATLLVGLCVLHGAFIFEPGRLTDEHFYEPAIEKAVAGGSPYEVPGFLYPPSFARAGSVLHEMLGTLGSRYTLRAVNLIGLLFILWFTVERGIRAGRRSIATSVASSGDATPPTWLLIALPVALLWTPGVGFGVFAGNFSFLVGAVALLGIWHADRRPILSGTLLAATLLAKPFMAGALPLFLLPTPRTRDSQTLFQRLHTRRVAAALLAGVLAVAALWVDRHELVHMLAAEPPDLAKKRSMSIFRIARELGFGELRLPLFAAATSILCVGFWGRLAGRRHLLVATMVAVPLTTLVVWGHTLVLFFPAAAMAIGSWLARRRAAGLVGLWAGTPEDRLETVVVLGGTALLLFAHPGGFADKPGIVQALLLVPPLLAPVALGAYWFWAEE